MTDTPTFAEWVILEVLGHRRLAGYLNEQQIAGHGYLRLDIPGETDTAACAEHFVATQLFNPTSVYAIHPTSEAIARHAAKTYRQAPLQRWELPAAPTPAAADDGEPDDVLAFDDVLEDDEDGDRFQ